MGFLSKAEKSRMSMFYTNILWNKILGLPNAVRSNAVRTNIVRILLIVTLVYYLPQAWFFPSNGKGTDHKNNSVQVQNGMGGGILAEKITVQTEMDLDLELSGIPEPEEYSRPHMLNFSFYTIKPGDMIGNIAAETGLNEDTLISVNNIKNTRLIQVGQVIRIPNQDGIYYAVKNGETLESIAEKYKTSVSHISMANELFSDILAPDSSLFIPGARMDWVNRQEINGDLFTWPLRSYISSGYGYRTDPFSGARQFHSGLDIGAAHGTPVRAAMSGRISHVGFDNSFGNYIVISHHSGYRTLYAHLSLVRVKAGNYVGTGERIGDVGSSGLSTGPHLHFTVYKNGVTVNPRALMK